MYTSVFGMSAVMVRIAGGFSPPSFSIVVRLFSAAAEKGRRKKNAHKKSPEDFMYSMILSRAEKEKINAS
jgi:hypothetical protein